MKYRIDVIKGLLGYMYDSEQAYVMNTELHAIVSNCYENNNGDYTVAYFNIITELQLVDFQYSSNFGFNEQSCGGSITYAIAELKVCLTYKGQEFIEKLNDKTIWNKICKNGSSLGLGTLKVIGSSLLQQYLSKL